MANDINYSYHTVQAGQDNTENSLAKIASSKGMDAAILEKLNPNYKLHEKLSAGTKVLVGAGSMTDYIDGFRTSTLYVYQTSTNPYAFAGTVTDLKGATHTIEIKPNANYGGLPDISLSAIVANLKNDNKWGDHGVPKFIDVGTLSSLNPWTGTQYALIPVGKTVLLAVCLPGTDVSVTIVKSGIQADTTRTCYVKWQWDHEVNSTEDCEVKWEYQTSDGQWWSGASNKVNKDSYVNDDDTSNLFESTYSPDERAIRARVKIKPSPKESNKTAVDFEWSAYLFFNFTEDFQAITPSSAPTVEIKNYKLTATYESLPVETGSITHVQFEVIRDDESSPYNEDHTVLFEVGVGGYVQYNYKIDAGHKYRVRARCVKKINEAVYYYSSWSPYSSMTNTLPTAPEFRPKECKILSNNVVQFVWSKVNSAEGYVLEYAKKDDSYKNYKSSEEYLDNVGINKETIQIEADKVTESGNNIVYKVPNMEYGDYLARVKAVNETESKWSGILGFALGEPSDPPTTWSSTTTVEIGEPLRLYWIHNALDGSEETFAEISLQTVINEDEVTSERTITVTKTLDNTISKIAATTKVAAYLIKAYNESLKDFGDDDVIEPGTLILISPGNNAKYVFVKSELEDITSFFELNTESYSEGAKIQWIVRTAGVLTNTDGTPAYGDWSINRTVDIYAPPHLTVNLLKNDDTTLSVDPFGNMRLTTLPFKVKMEVGNTQNQKPTGYHVSVIAKNSYMTVDEVGNDKSVVAGSKIFSKYYDVSDTSYTVELQAKDLTLENNEEYNVVCTVSMSSGLVGEVTTPAFMVGWVSQGYTPNAEIGIDKNALTARIRPFAIGAGKSVNLFVYKREFDGTFTELVTDSENPDSGLENETSTWITDPHPALDYARYRIVSRSKETGIINYFDAPAVPVQEKSVVIQWDEKWQAFDAVDGDAMMDNTDQSYSGSMLKLPYNIDVSNAHSPDVSLVRYIGRRRPVSYYGTQLGETATWNVVIPKSDKDTLYALRRLAIYMGNVYVREPSGSGYWANITLSFSQRHLDLTIPVTINITPVEGGV
jgi:hypothetical protein